MTEQKLEWTTIRTFSTPIPPREANRPTPRQAGMVCSVSGDLVSFGLVWLRPNTLEVLSPAKFIPMNRVMEFADLLVAAGEIEDTLKNQWDLYRAGDPGQVTRPKAVDVVLQETV